MPRGYVTLDGIDFNEIWYGTAGVAAAVDLYRQVDLPIIRALAMQSGEGLIKYGIGESNGFQLLGPAQIPDRKYVTTAVMYSDVKKYGYGVGTDADTLARSTGREIALALNRPMREDPENVLLRFLEVMMIDPGVANAGFGFYNGYFSAGEGITAPVRYQQQTFTSNHTHYITSGTANVLALTDITALKATIRHHGNTGQLVAFINSTTVQALENAASWQQSSIIRSPISDNVALNGFNESFQLLGVQWYVTESVPDHYVLMVTAAPEDQRVLIMYEPSNLKGLMLWPGTNANYPLIESSWSRWFGVKVMNRGAGAAMWFGAHTGTYVSPSFVG